jgi:L-ascorbate metabolism protein UlaG (beta-lactamase superfamily)
MDTGKLTWLGHATWLIETPGGKRVLVDPFLNGNPSCPEEFHSIAGIDLVALTHGHGDHVADAAAVAKRSGSTVFANFELGGWLEKQGVENVTAFQKGGTAEHAGVRVTLTNAFHSNSAPDGSYAGEPCGLIVTLEDGFRIYFAGDTCVFGDMALIAEIYRPDLAVLPIGGFYTMDPLEAAHAVRLLGVGEVVGSHYGTFPPLTGTPAKLREELERLGLASSTTVHDLEPGGVLPLRARVATA